MKSTHQNLVPDRVNPSPDYYCTWQTQLFATCNGGPAAQRIVIGEDALFGAEKPFGWSRFYASARCDLFLVMDDSWDVPPDGNSRFYGSLIPDPQKFPQATAGNVSPSVALGRLTERIRSAGWKGLGGWVCAQEPKDFSGEPETHWRDRLMVAAESGFAYWKVDWGKHCEDADFRRRLTALGHEIAPGLTIEHAITTKAIPHADVFRTYDVPAILSIPMTMRKLANLFPQEKPDSGCRELLNCEDEAYLAAAGGFTMGIMRHPYTGALPDGRPDPSFPALHRNLKTKMQEITRAVRWHRLAPAFGCAEEPFFADTAELCDTWHFEDPDAEMENWWFQNPLLGGVRDNTVTAAAPARLSRGCPLPSVTPDKDGCVPYVVAAKNPNGACSIATLGRTWGRTYRIPTCDIALQIGNARTVGAFGDYANLTLETDGTGIQTVLMQDLAADTAYDITDEVRFSGNRLTIPGALIRRIGTESQPVGDTSEPGVVIQLING